MTEVDSESRRVRQPRIRFVGRIALGALHLPSTWSSVHLEWGWVVMIAGSVVLGLSAAIPQSALAQGVDSTQALCHPQTPTQ